MCAVETKMSSTRFGMPCKYSLYVCRIDIMRMIGWMRSQFTYEWKERDLKTLWLNLEVDYGEGKELNKRDLFRFACAVALSFMNSLSIYGFYFFGVHLLYTFWMGFYFIFLLSGNLKILFIHWKCFCILYYSLSHITILKLWMEGIKKCWKNFVL